MRFWISGDDIPELLTEQDERNLRAWGFRRVPFDKAVQRIEDKTGFGQDICVDLLLTALGEDTQ